eukprot:symbB.v1.2.032889.t1/scaffold4012.1/size46427/3
MIPQGQRHILLSILLFGGASWLVSHLAFAFQASPRVRSLSTPWISSTSGAVAPVVDSVAKNPAFTGSSSFEAFQVADESSEASPLSIVAATALAAVAAESSESAKAKAVGSGFSESWWRKLDPEWCCAPRSPERHKQLVRAVGEAERSWEILDKSVYTVGRHETADFQLQGELVSRIHAAVLQDVEGERYLVDLKSTHGTFLESKRLKPHEPVKWPEGHLASFGFGPKALFLLLGSVSAEEKSVPTAAEDPTAEEDLLEPASKRPRTDAVEVDDPMKALYGDLPEAKLIEAPKVVESKMQPLPTPIKDPTRVIFLDIDAWPKPRAHMAKR